MSTTDGTRVYTTRSGYSEFAPRARTNGDDIWASPDGDLSIVLSAEQWTAFISLIQLQIDAKNSAEVPA